MQRLSCILRLEVNAMVGKLLLPVLLGLASSGSYSSPSIAYERVTFRRWVAHTVTVNLADPEVKVSVALPCRGRGYSESFKSMVKRTRPSAAITGTFFDTRTLIPTGDIALFGTLVHSGCIGSALCICADNKADIVPLGTGRKTRWTGYETVLCAGPTLVANGKVGIGLKHEGFRGSLMGGSRRTAVGITKSGKLLLVCVNRPISLYDLAKLMIKLNVRRAVCLDGGSSSALYFQGCYYAMPGRTLTNCLVIYSRERAYTRAKHALAPPKLFAKATSRTLPDPVAFIPAMITPPADAFPFSSRK
jgi:hypothetical protein